MFDKPIDFKKLHKALSSTYKRQMEIKKEFPHEYQYPPSDDFWIKKELYNKRVKEGAPWRAARSEFNELSYRMTKLCCIINHAKGKLHMKQYSYLDAPVVDLEWQYNFIDSDWQEFIKEEETVTEAA